MQTKIQKRFLLLRASYQKQHSPFARPLPPTGKPQKACKEMWKNFAFEQRAKFNRKNGGNAIKYGGSYGLLVIKRDSSQRGREFESKTCMLDGSFFT